jgi:hypothetical protein
MPAFSIVLLSVRGVNSVGEGCHIHDSKPRGCRLTVSQDVAKLGVRKCIFWGSLPCAPCWWWSPILRWQMFGISEWSYGMWRFGTGRWTSRPLFVPPSAPLHSFVHTTHCVSCLSTRPFSSSPLNRSAWRTQPTSAPSRAGDVLAM